MAYVNKELARKIRNSLKENFPEFKFSVRIGAGNYSVNVAVLSGPKRFYPADYVQINHFWPGNYENSDLLCKIIDIINCDNWDRSEPQYDHFDVGYHVNLSQGKYNKPFVLKG